jgi:DNA-binding CsgD family transcriptional regulator
MAKADLLRVQDVRDAYRLIGECRDLGRDPALWQTRMLEGLRPLIGVPVAVGGEGRWTPSLEAISAFDVGLDARGHDLYVAYHREVGPGGDPIFRALRSLRGRHLVRTRRDVVSDAVWYGSAAWNDYRRPIYIDDQLTSVYQVSGDGAVSVIALIRARNEQAFSPRHQRLLSFFHAELGPLIGRSLVSDTEPSADTLSPRLRQTLVCLLEGDSEKQIASRLRLSPATTHQYVTSLYRHFGVRSRAQLMAHAIKRAARADWKQLHADE